jgi:hypothetical protein
MASKHEPPPVTHPRFVAPVTAIDGGGTQVEKIVRESLRQAFELTPWHKAVVLQIRREDFQEVAAAVALVAGPTLAKRVYVNTVHRTDKRQEKRVMIDPHSGTEYLKGTPPWGEPPAPEVDLGEPPVATIGAEPQPGDDTPVYCPACGGKGGLGCTTCAGTGIHPSFLGEPKPPAEELPPFSLS